MSAVVTVALLPTMLAAQADQKLGAFHYDSKSALPSKNLPDGLARDGVTLAQATREAAPLAPELRAARSTQETTKYDPNAFATEFRGFQQTFK